MRLVDNEGRVQRYLRVSVTDRCNLKCIYCVPSKEFRLSPREEILTFEEVLFLIRFFHERFSINKVRLTGGEPSFGRVLLLLLEESSLTSLCVSVLPCADIKMTVDISLFTLSIALTTGSGFKTIPARPP